MPATHRDWTGLAMVLGLLLFVVDLPAGAYVVRSQTIHVFRPEWHWESIVRLLRVSLPVGFISLFLALNTSIPRFVVERYFGEHELGIFVALAYFLVCGQLLVGALTQAALPTLAKQHMKGDRHHFRVLLFKLVSAGGAIGVLGVIVTWVAGHPILLFVYGEAYARHSQLLTLLMIAGVFWYPATIIGFAALAARRIRLQPLALALVVLCTFGTALWLVPRLGLTGAAICVTTSGAAVLIAYCALMVFDKGLRPKGET